MFKLHRLILISFSALLLSACTPAPLFYWGDYETSIYDRMVKNDNNQGEDALKSMVAQIESGSKKAPPGLYADYGFMLYRRGDFANAIAYFEKEKLTFPESKQLMDTIIKKIRDKQEKKL